VNVAAALQRIRDAAPRARPRVAVLLGSGWGGFAAGLDDAVRVPYAELPGFPGAGVAGHAGELWLGRLGTREVAVLSGRRHTYEDGSASGMKDALATLRALGVDVLAQTNAAGSLDPAMPAGSLMLVRDHLNLVQRSPLVGVDGSERFVDMGEAYDAALRAAAQAAAARRGVKLHEGVYAWMLGPQFETPAEIRMLRALGADAVGMSTVPETIIARWLGMKVLGLSLVTNLAAGLSSQALSHAHTLAQAEAAAAQASALLAEVVRIVPVDGAPA
jgi:purine-nucleoside phosphorylase